MQNNRNAYECGLCKCVMPMADYLKYGHKCDPHELERQYNLAKELREFDEKKEREMEEKKSLVIKESIVMPAVTPDEAVKKWKEYQDLKEKIVEENDIQVIQHKSFLKKSYWRKLATFFNLSVEIVEEKSETLQRLSKEVIVYHFRARATAPNGRFAEGTGSCDIYDHATIHDGKFCTWDKFKKEWKEAEEKSLHNTRTTAETRAWNRAVSNLVGGGEVSAEEVKEEENGKEEPIKKETIPFSNQKPSPSDVIYVCENCTIEISKKVYDYSIKNSGKSLCYNCQTRKEK